MGPVPVGEDAEVVAVEVDAREVAVVRILSRMHAQRMEENGLRLLVDVTTSRTTQSPFVIARGATGVEVHAVEVVPARSLGHPQRYARLVEGSEDGVLNA